MAEPAAKKAKMDNFLPPIIFESPYFPKKPDVRLTIFNQQMHVHSEVLKMKSQFFNAFLDPPGTVDRTSYAGFKYEWVAKFDHPFEEPNDWGLRWLLTSLKKDEYPQCMDAGLVKGWPVREKDLFQKLLRIFYHDPYEVIDWEELETMTEIADYILALSSLSKGLHMDNIASRSLATACQQTPESVLPVAVKLRNKVLFKECIMCVINPWSLEGERIDMIEDEKIRVIAQKAYDTIDKRVNRVLRKIIDCVGAHGSPEEEQDEQLKTPSSMLSSYAQLAHNSGRDRFGRVCLPHLFYLVTKEGQGFFKEASDKWETDGLLKLNNSRLAFPGQVIGRDEAVLDHFLNVFINDADLPWDPAEKDW